MTINHQKPDRRFGGLRAVLLSGAIAIAAVSSSVNPVLAQDATEPTLTVDEVKAVWMSGPWGTENGSHYFLSGFKGEVEYNDSSIAPPNPAPFNAEWQKRYDEIRQAAFDGYNTYDVGADCSSFGHPFNAILGTHEFIFMPGERLYILYGNDIRRIYMDGRPLPEEILISQYDGYSVGHWEGSTLVIETVGMRDDRYIEVGMPHSDALRVIERYTPMGTDRIRLDMTLYDDKAFTGPWQGVPRYYTKSSPKTVEQQWLSNLDNDCENNRAGVIDGRTVLLDTTGKDLGADPIKDAK